MDRGSANSSLSTARIAVYARYSTDRQSDRSIEDQLARCARYVEERGGRVDPTLVFTDYAISGQSIRRGWEDLMRAVDARAIDVIVAESVSRVSRDFADAAAVFKRLEYLKVALHGVGDGIDTSARGAKLSFGLKSLIDDHYIDALRDVTLRGLEQRAREGLCTGGLPYAYRSRPDPNGRGHLIEIDADRAEVVRRIFDWAAAQVSQGEIARRLNREGVSEPRSSRRRRVAGWSSTSVRSILRNAKYRGAWTFGERRWMKDPVTRRRRPQRRDPSEIIRVERPDLRIIDEPIWDQVQERVARRATAPTRRCGYLLSGLLRCGECGGVMAIHGGDPGRRYYGCAAARSRGTCTNLLAVSETEVRSHVVNELRAKLSSPTATRELHEIAAAELAVGRRSTDAQRRERTQRLERTEARIRGLVEYLAEGDRSEYVVSALRELEAQARAERAAIAAIDREARGAGELPTAEVILERLAGLDVLLARASVHDLESARQALRSLADGDVIRLMPEPDGYVARGAWLSREVRVSASRRVRRARRTTPIGDGDALRPGDGE